MQPRGTRLLEPVQVEADRLECPCRRAGAARVARPDVLVQRDEGREAELGEEREDAAQVREVLGVVYAPGVRTRGQHASIWIAETGDDARAGVFYGLPGHQEPD